MRKKIIIACTLVVMLILTVGLFGFKKPAGRNYIIVSGTSTFELESTVSFRMGGGYTCVGWVSTFIDRGRTTFIQAMAQ